MTWVLWAQVPLGLWGELEPEKPRYFQRTQSRTSVQWPQVFHQVKGNSYKWTRIDRTCLFGPNLSTLKSNWTDAFAFCRHHGGEMANWDTLDTNQLLRDNNEFITPNWKDIERTGQHEAVISSYWLDSGPKGTQPLEQQPFVVNDDGTPPEYTRPLPSTTMGIIARPCANHFDANVTLDRQCLKLNMKLIKHKPSTSSLPSSMMMDWNYGDENKLPSPSLVFCWEMTSCSNKAALPLCVRRGLTCPPHHLALHGKGSSSRFKRFINHPFGSMRRIAIGSQDYSNQHVDKSREVGELDLIPENDDEDHPEEERVPPKTRKHELSNRVGELTQPTQKCCPSPWIFTDDGCYLVDKITCPQGCSWEEAKAGCDKIGGSMAVLGSESSRMGALKSVEDNNDEEIEQLFWVELPEESSGDTRRHWCSGFPQSINKNLCVQLSVTTNGTGCWENELCQHQRWPICYRDYDTHNCSQGFPLFGSKIGLSNEQISGSQQTSMLPKTQSSTTKPSTTAPKIITSSISQTIESSTKINKANNEANKSLKKDPDIENSVKNDMGSKFNGNHTASHNFMDVLKNIKLIERMEIIVEQQSQILKDIKEEYKREQSENVGGEDLSMSDNDQEDPPAENGQILERANNIRTLHENLEIPKEIECRRDLAELSQCFICTLQLGTLGDPCHCSKIIGTLIDKFLGKQQN